MRAGKSCEGGRYGGGAARFAHGGGEAGPGPPPGVPQAGGSSASLGRVGLGCGPLGYVVTSHLRLFSRIQ